jgi:uncharacterized protein YecT (DUF1311 family)
MSPRLVVVIAILCLAVSYIHAQKRKPTRTQDKKPCASARTQGELNDCFCNQYRRADDELNRIYQELMAANGNDRVFVDKLKIAQRAWIAFRDAQVEATYPETGEPRVKYGSVYPMCYCMAQQDLTAERTKHLRRMLSSKGGDVCGWDIH